MSKVKRIFLPLIVLSVVALTGCGQKEAGNQSGGDEVVSEKREYKDAELFLSFLDPLRFIEQKSAKEEIERSWDPSYVSMVLEVIRFAGVRDFFAVLEEKTGQSFGNNLDEWYAWLWNEDEVKNADYAYFKSQLYKEIDDRFEKYFLGRGDQTLIRLDEVQWGGVVQDGIPPLRNPEMITVADATYLNDEDIVFGIEVNGDVRAYPKRILAWHEMFVDEVGGVPVAGVYCTLCGTVVLYETVLDGTEHALGTSGFLYRSNKLMYDGATQSLWNTLTGEPVIGPLINKGIALKHRSVVTTTWGAWKERHPNTEVLSLETGHRRDYGEGVAYNEYFATDDLMFQTPFQDDRLLNKQEVLALRFPAHPGEQLAIDAEFLNDNIVYQDQVGEQKLIVFTDKSGANRVYDPGEIVFTSYDGDSTVTDSAGGQWTLSENALTAADGQSVSSLPYHRAFWFGWHAAYPETRLVSGE